MPNIRIVNCHVHLFTGAHIPKNYPHWLLRPFKRFPGVLPFMAWLIGMLAGPATAEQLRRLQRFLKQAGSRSQRHVMEDLRRHYPPGTRFVVLPMDLSRIGH